MMMSLHYFKRIDVERIAKAAADWRASGGKRNARKDTKYLHEKR